MEFCQEECIKALLYVNSLDGINKELDVYKQKSAEAFLYFYHGIYFTELIIKIRNKVNVSFDEMIKKVILKQLKNKSTIAGEIANVIDEYVSYVKRTYNPVSEEIEQSISDLYNLKDDLAQFLQDDFSRRTGINFEEEEEIKKYRKL